MDVATDIIDFGIANGLKAIQLTGGEPAAYSELNSLILHAHKRGVYSFVATSGYNHSIKFYRMLKQSGLTILCVSINDIDESVNRLTRDAFDTSLTAIKEAVETGLICCANVVLSDTNINNFELLARYLQRIGVERIDVLRPIISFDKKYIPAVSLNTIERLHTVVSKNPDFFRVENCFKEYWEYVKKETFKCYDAGDTSVFVNVDGTLSPCSKMMNYRYNSIEEMMKNRNEWKGGCCR